ncbi:MAG: SH3 domain-containing protein [Spirochaetales bacterium]|nr:SH3 domain-containing protein [Spirochaetales bacterium]
MNKKQGIFLFSILIFIHITSQVFSEAPSYDLETEYVMEFPWMEDLYIYLGYKTGYIFLSSGVKAYKINPKEKTVYEYDKYTEIFNILGEKGDKLIISRRKPDTRDKYFKEDAYVDLYLYNPVNNEYEYLKNIIGGSVYTEIKNIFYYYNNIYLATRYSDETYEYVSIDSSDGLESMKGDGIYGISPDKMHAFLKNKSVSNLVTGKKIGKYGSGNSFFVTNDLFFTDNLGHLDVCDLTGEVKASFNYLAPSGNIEYDYYDTDNFKKVMGSVYGVSGYTKNGKIHRIIVKTPNEMEYLDKLSLLFHHTTATLNDDRVRMREWPLLDAKHIAFLEKGEKVEVLDRSGIKVKIDNMEDYWYKLRRQDGTEGWSYGYFLDLAAE